MDLSKRLGSKSAVHFSCFKTFDCIIDSKLSFTISNFSYQRPRRGGLFCNNWCSFVRFTCGCGTYFKSKSQNEQTWGS